MSTLTIDSLARQGRTHIPTTLAEINTSRLKQMRNEGLRSCFERFSEMHYRMEFEARIHDKSFINDASSCNVNATWFTLETMTGSLVWIAEACDPNVDYSRLRSAALRKVREIYCVGSETEALHKAFAGIVPSIIDVHTLGDAVNRAFYNNLNNATIIYSPAADNGRTTRENGELFHHEVNEL